MQIMYWSCKCFTWCVGLEADLVYTIEIVAENEKGEFDGFNYCILWVKIGHHYSYAEGCRKKTNNRFSVYACMSPSLENLRILNSPAFFPQNIDCATLQRLNVYVDNRISITVLSIRRSVRQLFYVISRTIMEKI